MARRYKKKTANVVVYIILITVLLVAMNYMGVFKGFDLNEFRIDLNGSRIKSDSLAVLQVGVKNEFKISRPFGIEKDDVFAIRVVPNTDLNFDYSVNGNYRELTDLDDYKNAFNLEYGKDCFYLSVPKGVTMQSILTKINESEVELYGEYDLFNDTYFFVEVSTKEEVSRFEIRLHYYIMLDKEGIVF